VANQKILLKRSATQYKIPTTTQLQLGELGLNTYDGKLFIEKDVSGTASIVELGVGPTFQLTTGGSPAHTHSVSITGQQALDLLSGTATTITVRSSSNGTTAHTHDVTIEYDTTTKGFVLNTAGGITSNHTAAHTLVSNGGGVSSLAALSDVDTTGIANDKILKYDSASSTWKIADDAEGTTIAALTDITDVATGATNGQVLNWDTSVTPNKWKPVDQAGGHAYTEGTTTPSSPSVGDEFYNQTSDTLYKYVNDGSSNAWIDISTDSVLSIANIDNLGDVDTTTTAPTSGQVLKWNTASSKWYPADDIDTTLSLSTADLTDIGDVDTGATNGQVLKWNVTGTKWVPSDDTNTDTVYTHPNHSGDVTSLADGATTIGNDKVTYAKMQNVSATDRILGRDTAGAGDVEEITPSNLRTMINVEDGATNIGSLTDISDVDTGATDGQVLKWNTTGTKWVPSDDTIGLLTDKGSTTVGTTVVLLDSWSATTYLSAKYYVTCKVGTSYSTSEIRILNNGGASSDIIEYGHLGTNIITFSTSIVSGNVQLNGISTTASTVVRVARVLQGV